VSEALRVLRFSAFSALGTSAVRPDRELLAPPRRRILVLLQLRRCRRRQCERPV